MCKWLTLVGRRRPAADGETDQRGWAGLTAGGWIMYVSIELLVAANLCGGHKGEDASYLYAVLSPSSVCLCSRARKQDGARGKRARNRRRLRTDSEAIRSEGEARRIRPLEDIRRISSYPSWSNVAARAAGWVAPVASASFPGRSRTFTHSCSDFFLSRCSRSIQKWIFLVTWYAAGIGVP